MLLRRSLDALHRWGPSRDRFRKNVFRGVLLYICINCINHTDISRHLECKLSEFESFMFYVISTGSCRPKFRTTRLESSIHTLELCCGMVKAMLGT